MSKTTGSKKKDQTASYYNLHTQAVDDLVGATKENTPRYSRTELEKYRSGKMKWRFPEWLKVGLIKYWFYAAVCYFVFMGLGMYVTNQIDLFFIAAVVMGMVTDLLLKHFLRFVEKLPGGNEKWILVSRGGAPGFLLNVVYGFVLLMIVVTVYYVINSAFGMLVGEAVPLLAVEPILFGLFATLADTLCIAIRNTLLNIIRDARRG